MGWKEQVADYFQFTRRDRIAIITLLLLIGVVYFLPTILFPGTSSKQVKPDSSWVAAMKRIEHRESERDQQEVNYQDENSSSYQYDQPAGTYYKRPAGDLFYFDPNTLPAEGWKRLGLRDKTIRTIQHYLSKGGKFRKPEDLERIYGLFPDELERLIPYIRIESSSETSRYTDFIKDTQQQQQIKSYRSRYSDIDINTADTAALIALPGIGNKLATRIINFRDKLGGFYSISQVGETFGLPDSTFQKIKQYLKLEKITLRKININTATTDELKIHPYIKWSLANPIVAYRNEHGLFTNLEDLKKIMAVTDELYNKIVPYLTLQ